MGALAENENTGSLSQEELDRLFSGGDAPESTVAAEPEEASTDEDEPETGGSLNQSDLDALFSGDDAAEGAATSESEETPAAEAKAETGGSLDQSDLDALFSGDDAAEGAAASEPEEDPAAEAKAETGGSLDQSDLDALFSGDDAVEGAAASEPEETPIAEEEAETGGSLDQSDLDALFSGDDAAEGAAASEPEETPIAEEEAETGGSLDQSDLDALFSGDDAAEGAAASVSEEDPAVEAKAEAGGSLDQSDLDALFSGDDAAPSPAPAALEEAPADEAESRLTQADLDALLSPGEEEGRAQTGGIPATGEPDDASEMAEDDTPTEADDPAGIEDAANDPAMERLISELAGEEKGEKALSKPEEESRRTPPPETDGAFSADAPVSKGFEAEEEEDDDFVGLEDTEMEIDGYEGDPSETAGQAETPETASEAEAEPDAGMGEAAAPAATSESPRRSGARKKAPKKTASVGSSKWLKRMLLLMATAVLILGGFGGWMLHTRWRTAARAVPKAPNRPVVQQPVPQTSPAEKPRDGGERAAAHQPPLPPEIAKGLSEIEDLRHRMTAKQTQLDDLRTAYLEKVRRVQNEIVTRANERGIATLKEALRDREIELALKTVQRRLAYVSKLEEPAARLNQGSEALYFVQRLTEIDWQLADVTRGLDADVLTKRMREAMERHRLDPDNLAVDIQPTDYPGLESVWASIGDRISKAPSKPSPPPAKAPPAKAAPEAPSPQKKAALNTSPLPPENDQIIREVIAGNFDHVFHLTQLTPEAAQRLSKWENRELFLNDLNRLSSQEAAYLSKWSGHWLTLNGLSDLSTDVARHLMHWRGERLSLNGIDEVTPNAARYLAQWSGKQIELVGLRRLSPEAAKLLSRWQKNGGRVFVPERFKRRRKPAPSQTTTATPARSE